VDPEVLIPVALVVGGATVLAGRLAWRTRRLAATTGAGGLVGAVAEVGPVTETTGQVLVQGAWWNVKTRGEQLREGATVRVVEVEGLDLVVEEQEAPPIREDREGRERGET
jgi:membrane-bound serine protease (ClpP class)